jgi:hypothetical protein
MFGSIGRTLGDLATSEADEDRRAFVLGLRAIALELRAVVAALYGPGAPRKVRPTAQLLQRAAATVVVLAEDLR